MRHLFFHIQEDDLNYPIRPTAPVILLIRHQIILPQEGLIALLPQITRTT